MAGWTIPISVSTDEQGEIHVSLFVEIGVNQLRERRIAAFSVTNNKTDVIIVTIELEPAYSRVYPMRSERESNLQATLRQAAADFISRSRETNMEAIRDRILDVLEPKE